MLYRQRRFFSGFKLYLAQTANQSIGVAPMFFLLCTEFYQLINNMVVFVFRYLCC